LQRCSAAVTRATGRRGLVVPLSGLLCLSGMSHICVYTAVRHNRYLLCQLTVMAHTPATVLAGTSCILFYMCTCPVASYCQAAGPAMGCSPVACAHSHHVIWACFTLKCHLEAGCSKCRVACFPSSMVAAGHHRWHTMGNQFSLHCLRVLDPQVLGASVSGLGHVFREKLLCLPKAKSAWERG
jgi:hypothetical protein